MFRAESEEEYTETRKRNSVPIYEFIDAKICKQKAPKEKQEV
jgi:hypothetical protein